MKKRTALSKRTRFEIFKRDNFQCQYCGAHPPDVVLVCDHIVPVVEGGLDDDGNLVAACEPCNQGKGPIPLCVVPESLKDRANRIAEQEAQLRGYHAVMEAQRQRIDDDVWRVADVYIEQYTDGIRKDYLRSVHNFVIKLGVYECLDAMEAAVARVRFSKSGCFRYFCGICWRKINGPPEDAP